jgi:hypothetical protein
MPKEVTMRTIGAIILVAAVAGRLSSNPPPFDNASFERAYASCIESVALEFRDKVKGELRQAEREWEAKHSPYRWPL